MEPPQGMLAESFELEDAADRRRAAEHVHESLTVEAGAGTGKTTLLVARIVNLLRGVRPDLPPAKMSEIVAITFTEKAAGELKTRLRTVLEEAVVTGQFNDAPLAEQERARLRDALEDLDRAVVSTIHSFCASLIRERPVEAGIDPGRTTADALTQSLLFEEAWERWRGQAFENPNDEVLAAALRSELKADRSSPLDRSPSLRDLAATLVSNRDLLAHLPAPIDEQAEWDKLKPIIDEHCAATARCLRHMKRSGDHVDKPSRLAFEFNELWSTLRTKSPSEARRILRSAPEEPGEELRGRRTSWRDAAKLDELKRLLSELYERILPDARAVLSHNLIVELGRRMQEFASSYEDLKTERGLLDFQDMLLIARDMLVKSEEARDYFHRRFRHLLIDEFQDTDPLQAEVAWLLASHHSPLTPGAPGLGSTHHSLFLVGDPKQSIYRFRRADIEFYEQCTRRLGDTQRVYIRQNFRSGAGIINWVNRVFASLIERPADAHYQPDYVRLIPGPLAHESPGRVVLLYPPDPEKDRSGNIDEVRFREGCCIAQFIRGVVDRWDCSREPGTLQYGHVAILLPTTTGVDEYEEAFRACGLPYHIIGGKHFYQRVEIKSLLNVLTAIDNPEDGIAVVGALRSPFFGCSDEDLLRHALAGGRFNYLRPRAKPAEPLAGIFDLLHRLHRDRNVWPVATLLKEFFDATKGLEGFLTKPHGESRVANLLKVADAARSIERSGPAASGFRGFVRWLRERQSAREEESESPSAEAGDNAVQVLTVHKSKGLEFPMTIVANLNAGRVWPAEQLVFDRLAGKLHLKCGPLSTAGWREAQDWELRRAEAERKRLFYVAATRARDYLVLPVFWQKLGDPLTGMHAYLDQINNLLPEPNEKLKWDQPHGDMFIYDTRNLPPWPEPQHAPRVDLAQLAGDPDAEKFLHTRTEWQRARDAIVAAARKTTRVAHASELAPSRAPLAASPPAASDAQGLRPRDAAAGPEFGSLVHRLVELHFTRGLRDDALVTTAERLAADAGLDPACGKAAADLVLDSLDAPLFTRLRAARRASFEVPFAYSDGDRIVEGRIDAIAEEADGILVVDFKTDHVEPGAESKLAEHYARQLRAYATAVAAATGRPARDPVLFFLRTRQQVSVQASDATARL